MREYNSVPSINVGHDYACLTLAMSHRQIFAYPCHQVVFEATLDELMKEIRHDKVVNVSTGKMNRERLHCQC